MRLYKDFFWLLLPNYYHEKDTYKDVNGKGLLERYLSLFGSELDEKFFTKVNDLPNQLSPETASNEFLSEIAYQVGKPLDILEDIEVYRTLLTMIISIYKLKGTTESYKIFFGILGYTITIEELFPLDNIYDNGAIYDDNVTLMKYDVTNCETLCTDYKILYTPIPELNTVELSESEKERVITSILLYLQPNNSNLISLDYVPN